MIGLLLSSLGGYICRNLWAGARLALFLPIERSSFSFGAVPLAAAWALAVLCYCIVQLPFAWPVAAISPWGANFLLASFFSILAALHLGALLVGLGAQSGRLQVMVLSTLPATYLVIMVLQLSVFAELLPREAAWGVYPIYILPLIAAARGTALLDKGTLLRGLVPAAAFSGAIVFTTFFLVPSSIFEPADDYAGDDAEAWTPVDVEHVYYAQPELLEGQLARLRPGVPGQVELYALLLAYYPNQRVFLREVDTAGAIVADQFGAEGRIVRLANSRAQPERYPLANRHNLDAALARIAEVMNAGEDVLLLYLTSHGSKEVISAGYWEVGTADLGAQSLAAALADSGLGNAVVVISACKSGSFVPSLAAPNRLIITAAAAGRNSFGCADENNWTYFGEAFFDRALRSTHDFAEAFGMAADLVAEWEHANGQQPSDPQMALGPEIAPVLERLAAARP